MVDNTAKKAYYSLSVTSTIALFGILLDWNTNPDPGLIDKWLHNPPNWSFIQIYILALHKPKQF